MLVILNINTYLRKNTVCTCEKNITSIVKYRKCGFFPCDADIPSCTTPNTYSHHDDERTHQPLYQPSTKYNEHTHVTDIITDMNRIK